MSQVSTPRYTVRYRKLRAEAIANYGGKCVVCGEHRIKLLTIDHIDGGGKQHLREIRTPNLTKWLAARGFPAGFQVLCWNHNYLKHLLTSIGSRPTVDTPRAKSNRHYKERMKAAVIQTYGGCCSCCGETDPRLLTVDHVSGDGANHRRSSKSAAKNIWLWLGPRGYHPSFRLLCHNCNSGRQVNGGICPHVTNP